jgi:dipeptidyl aminopeptidase/acylaminoacyl peptidase
MLHRRITWSLVLMTCFSYGQDTLQLAEIMQGEAFIGSQPVNPRWSANGQRIYFEWNPNQDPGTSTYYWEKGMVAPLRTIPGDKTFSAEQIAGQAAYAMCYYTENGALCAYNPKTGQHTRLLRTSSPAWNVQRVVDPQVVYFQQDGNLFQLHTQNGSLFQVTHFKQGLPPMADAPEPPTFLEKQQSELFEYIRERERQQQWQQKQAPAPTDLFPKAIYTGRSALENVQISPDQQCIVFRLSDYPAGTHTNVERYITDDGHTQALSAREKVSVHNLSKHRLGVYNISKDSTWFFSFAGLSHLSVFPAFATDSAIPKAYLLAGREISMDRIVFNHTGTFAVADLRSLDNKDRWIVQLDLIRGTLQEIDYQHDEAWIGGPGISESETLGFLKDQQTVYFQSEVSGYSHLYTVHLPSRTRKQLTSGKWEVRSVQLSANGQQFYLSANRIHPGNLEFYHCTVSTGKLTPVLTATGAHEVVVSPDEKTLLVRYSYKTRPWELYISANQPNATLQPITHSTSAAFNAHNWIDPEVITFTAQDGTPVHARLYKPQSTSANQAAVIFVHGAGYLQNAHNYWSYYQREYMFHNLLAAQGYTVLDIDYRASDGYGHDFRTGIYRHMGGLDLSDQLDGKTYLVNQLGIDPQRVGIYGGSYGGFITLMALLTKPGEFACGAALRSVTDWAHYNHGYTGNILNFPETDPQAYQQSSPIYFAENLQDPLLMLHGMVDDNVQFQDVVRLSERFIELGKKDWNLAVFPVEAHSFKTSYSWTDEYRRILELFNQHLLKK